MVGFIAKTKKLLMSIEWAVTFLCIFLAAMCDNKSPLDLNYNAFDQ